jgi:hypothetical protein
MPSASREVPGSRFIHLADDQRFSAAIRARLAESAAVHSQHAHGHRGGAGGHDQVDYREYREHGGGGHYYRGQRMFQRHLSDESLHGNLAMSKIYR